MLFELVVKDLKLFLYDKKTLAVFLVMPIVLMTILGISLSGIFSNDDGSPFEQIRLGVVKNYNVEEELSTLRDAIDHNQFMETEVTKDSLGEQEKGEKGAEEEQEEQEDRIDVVNMDAIFFHDFLEQEQLQEWVTVSELTQEEIQEAIESDVVDAVIMMPKGYVYKSGMNMVGIGRRDNPVQLIINPEHSMKGELVQGILNSFVGQVNRQKAQTEVIIGDLIATGNVATMESFIEGSLGQEVDSVDIEMTSLPVEEGKSVDSFQYYSVAIMSMFILYVASFSGFGMRREKRFSTLSRAYVGGISIRFIIMSNFIKTVLLVILQMAVMMLYSTLVLGVSWGILARLPLNMLLIGIVVGALGSILSLIGLIMDSDMVIKVFEMAIIQFMALIGGSFIPVEVLPEAIGHMKFLSISGLAMDLFINGMMEQPYNQIMGTLGIIGVYIIATLLIVVVVTEGYERRWRTC